MRGLPADITGSTILSLLARRSGSTQYDDTRERQLADGRRMICPADGATALVVLRLEAPALYAEAGVEAAVTTHLTTPAIASATTSAARFALWCAGSIADSDDYDGRALPYTSYGVDRGLTLATMRELELRTRLDGAEPVLLEVVPALHYKGEAENRSPGSYLLRVSVRNRAHVALIMCLELRTPISTDDPLPGEWVPA